jgi:hopanoid biosynthesis associated RND transporter like protein HpnN
MRTEPACSRDGGGRGAGDDTRDAVLARIIAGVAALACRLPWLVVAFTVVTCAGSVFYALNHLTYQTQRSDLIDKQKGFYQRWQRYLAEFGDDDDMIVVVRGESTERLRRAIDDLAADIKGRPELFDRLFYRVDLRGLRNRALLFLPTEELRGIQDSLRNMALLLDTPVLGVLNANFSWQMLTMQQLLTEGDRRAAALAVDPQGREDSDPLLRQLAAICRGGAETLRDPAAYRNPWLSMVQTSRDGPPKDVLTEPQHLFSGDGKLAFVMVRPLKDNDGFTFSKQSIDGLREILRRHEARNPDLDYGLTGLPVLENDEVIASQQDSQTASWLALAGVALLYFAVYRGIRYPLMTVATLLVGTVWALGWLTLTIGHLNILSSAFAVMLIGMGDYGVLWVTRFGQERQAGHDVASANRQTALHVGPSILTEALTTALAFFAAMLADLRAVAELGWIAGSGVLLCALACFVVMPALLTLFDWRWPEEKALPPVISLAAHQAERRAWLARLTGRPWVVLGVGAALTVGLGVAALGTRYDHNILNLQSPRLDSVKWEHELIERSAGDCWFAVTMTSTPEEALALKRRYEALPAVSRVVEVATLVPREQDRKLEILRDVQQRLRRLPKRGTIIEHTEPNLNEVKQAGQRLLVSLDRLATTPLVSELRTGVRDLLDVLGNLPGAEAVSRLQAFQRHVAGDLLEDLHQLREASTPAPIELTDLPEALRERYVGKSGKWLLCVFAKENLWEYEALSNFVAEVERADPEACGRPFSTLAGLQAMRNGFFWAGVYALIAMIIVLLLDFGNIQHTALALTPLFMGALATLGLLTLFGVPLNPANMIAFPLILGVGADNGVHVLHDFRARDRRCRYLLNYATGRGIMVAALTTVLGFGTLMLAQHRGIASLGLVLALGVSCCMLAALVVLPALLSLVHQTAQQRQEAAPLERRRAA